MAFKKTSGYVIIFRGNDAGGNIMRQGTKLKDIAIRTGYSINTISRALRDMPDISEKTRNKIKEIAREMNYLPNHAAMSLRTKRSKSIGVIVADITNPVFSDMVKGAEMTARIAGYSIILGNSNEDYKEEEAVVETLISRNVDGIILVPTMNDKKIIQSLQSKRIPMVLMGRRFLDLKCNWVINDDKLGGYMVGKHLLEKGHRKFAYITGPLYISSAIDRLEGFRDALKESGLSPGSLLVFETKATPDGGYVTMQKLLDCSVDVSAVFCFSDFIAFGALKALKERGISIPDDIAVVGFDNIFFSGLSAPALTTINIAKNEIGTKATELLIEQLNTADSKSTPLNKGFNSHNIVLKPTLVVRDTT
jgi:LacI family transcriptional regulator